MSRHIFASIGEHRFPIPGELIRNIKTGNYINVVIEVTPMPNDEYGRKQVAVRSVRYGKTNRNEFIAISGTRSRSILMDSTSSNWQIVEEYTLMEDRWRVLSMVLNLRNTTTAYVRSWLK